MGIAVITAGVTTAIGRPLLAEVATATWRAVSRGFRQVGRFRDWLGRPAAEVGTQTEPEPVQQMHVQTDETPTTEQGVQVPEPERPEHHPYAPFREDLTPGELTEANLWLTLHGEILPQYARLPRIRTQAVQVEKRNVPVSFSS